MAALIMGAFFAFSAFAQGEWTKPDLQSIYTEHLRQEGYLPSIDMDGDIQFKVSGDNYFIIIDESDVQFFQIYMGFSLGSITADEAFLAANYSNRRSKVAKTTISSDGNIASITVELILNDPRDFMPVFSRALSLIRNAENIFRSHLREMSLAGTGARTGTTINTRSTSSTSTTSTTTNTTSNFGLNTNPPPNHNFGLNTNPNTNQNFGLNTNPGFGFDIPNNTDNTDTNGTNGTNGINGDDYYY